MKSLIDRIDKLIEKQDISWTRNGHAVSVELWKSGRKQKVLFKRRNNMYIFYSVVVRADYFRNAQLRRDVAYRAWRKNALKDLVGFAFDERRQLVGTIEQPVETLDHEELQLYIDVLAKECDRFEYVLTGEDME